MDTHLPFKAPWGFEGRIMGHVRGGKGGRSACGSPPSLVVIPTSRVVNLAWNSNTNHRTFFFPAKIREDPHHLALISVQCLRLIRFDIFPLQLYDVFFSSPAYTPSMLCFLFLSFPPSPPSNNLHSAAKSYYSSIFFLTLLYSCFLKLDSFTSSPDVSLYPPFAFLELMMLMVLRPHTTLSSAVIHTNECDISPHGHLVGRFLRLCRGVPLSATLAVCGVFFCCFLDQGSDAAVLSDSTTFFFSLLRPFSVASE